MGDTDLIKLNDTVFSEIRSLIEQSRLNLAVAVNATMTMLYWQIGNRINKEVLGDKRAEYGGQVVSTLSKQLQVEYGRGWSEKQLRHCLRFAEIMPDEEIVSALRRQCINCFCDQPEPKFRTINSDKFAIICFP